MNKILLFAAFTLIFLIQFSSAASGENERVFKEATVVDFKVPCFMNGTYCSAAAICNITILRQDGSTVLQNRRMTNQIQFHNITLTQSQTDAVGVHEATVVCQDGAIAGSSIIEYLISPSGQHDEDLKQITLLAFVGIFSILSIIVGYWKEDAYLIAFGSIVMTILGLYTLNNGIATYRTNLTEAISFVITGAAAYLSIKALIEVINENL